MAKTLEQILGYVYLCGLVEDIKTGVPDVLPKEFMTTKSETLADQGRYTRYAGTRQTIRRVEYGSASFKRALSAIGSFDVKLLHSYEHIELNVKDYQSLRNYTNYQVQNMGVQEVSRQYQQFRKLLDNNRISTICSMLTKGAIYHDIDGHLLPSSSGAVSTVDYGVGANNQNQLNGIIAASWATTSTDIPAHLRALKQRSAQQTGYPLKYAFYGKNIPSYFTTNTLVQAYLSRNPQTHQQWLDTGDLPDGLFGFTWVPAYLAFFEDSGNTNRVWWGDDQVVFTPEIDSSVYELMEGTYPVPKSYQPVSNLSAAMDAFDLKHGMFGYAVPVSDPMTARCYAGDTFLPIWKVPDALYIADVTP